MKILGISLGHDSSFALIIDGKIAGMMEAERYFRQKRYKLHCVTLESGQHDGGFQKIALEDLKLFLSMAKDEWGAEFDYVAVQNQGRIDEYNNLRILLEETGIKFDYIHNIDHHLSHAALAFYTAPFAESVVLSYDGYGNDGVTVIFKAGADGLEYIKRSDISFGRNYNNLGFIVGVKPDVSGTGAGKTMGLSAYGEAREDWLPYATQYVQQYRKLPPKDVEGLSSYGKGHRINSIGLADIPEVRQYITQVEAMSSRGLRGAARDARSLGVKKAITMRLTGDRTMPELCMPGLEDKLTQDLVQTVQTAWTEQVIELVKPYSKISDNLCVVGGCALNGIANYALQQSGLFNNIHFVPNSSDCGLSAGAALYAYYSFSDTTFNGYDEYFSPYLGLEPFDRHDLPTFKEQYPHRELQPEETSAVLARLIHNDLIVGVIRGRYEIGPRALGNRSILCNPLNKDMRDILNDKVKHREWYRPFAPVSTAEDAPKYFTNSADIPYMSVICYTRPEYADQLPAVTHVDGSSRLQTIRREQNSFLYDTLKEFEKLSGMPILLNTSFNPGGEPIINFCAVGLEMLKTTGLDLVLIDNLLFCKPDKEDLLNF